MARCMMPIATAVWPAMPMPAMPMANKGPPRCCFAPMRSTVKSGWMVCSGT